MKNPTLTLRSIITGIAASFLLAGSQVQADTTNIFGFQKGNLTTNGVVLSASYSGVLDGVITDNNAATTITTIQSVALGNVNRPGSTNGQQNVALFSYDLTELNNYLTANNTATSKATVTSVSLTIISSGNSNGAVQAIALFGTDPFTATATWSNYTSGSTWTLPWQNLGAPTNTAIYAYTGGGSALTASLGGSNPSTGRTNGASMLWTSSANFISAITNATARTDKTLYLTARVNFFSNADNRGNFITSTTNTVASRPLLQVTVNVSPISRWTGGANTSWITPGNWLAGTIPATDDSIYFDNNSTANLGTVLNQNFSVSSINVVNPSGAVTIGGANTLTNGAGGIDLSAATQNLTISAPLVLSADQSWNVGTSRTLSVNGGVSGSAALTVSGSGKVSLGSAATHTGNTTVSAGGTLQMGAANVLPNLAGGGNVNVNGVLDLNTNAQAVNGLTGSGVVDNTAVGATTLTIGSNNTNSTFSGTIQNTGGALALVKTGAGTATLNGTNTYTGGTTMTNGTVVPGNDSAFGTGTIAVNAGATAYPVSTMTITNALALNGGYLHAGGAGSSVIWSGPVTVLNGFTMSGDTSTTGNKVSGSIDIGTGGIYVTNNTGNGQAGNNFANGDLLSGTISGSGGITYYLNNGNSRLTVYGTNTYSGNTVVSQISAVVNGKLNVFSGSTATNYPFSTGTVTLNASAIIESYPGSTTITNALTLNGGTLESESQFNNYNALTWAGPVTLTANSTLLQFGQGALNNNQSVGVTVSGSLNMGGFTLTCSSSVQAYNGNIISGQITGAGNILQSGLNGLTISGSNTFSGTFRSVTNFGGFGTLFINNVYALQNATLDMNAADTGSVSFSTNVIIGALTGSRDLNLGTGASARAISIGNNNVSTTYSGALTNGGSVTKIGTGTLTLNGTNTYTGKTTISAGTLALSGSGSIASTNIIVAGGAGLDVSGLSSVFALAGSTLTNSSVGAVFNGTNNCSAGTLALVYDGVNPSFIQTNGTMTLSASTVIQVNNTGVSLANGSYTIIAAATAGNIGQVTGPLPAVAVTGNGAAGTASLQINGSGGLNLVVASAATPPPAVINSVSVSGNNLILQGTNGALSGTYSILTSTNVASPLPNWTTNASGTFTAGGAFSNAIPATAEPQRYFNIKQP